MEDEGNNIGALESVGGLEEDGTLISGTPRGDKGDPWNTKTGPKAQAKPKSKS